MPVTQEQLFVIRAKQCLAEIDAFVKELARKDITVPQSLADAIEAFRESVREEV